MTRPLVTDRVPGRREWGVRSNLTSLSSYSMCKIIPNLVQVKVCVEDKREETGNNPAKDSDRTRENLKLKSPRKEIQE